MSVMGIIINTILYQFSTTAVAIYGISIKVQNIAQIVVNGMNNGLIPIIAYNYGAKMKKESKKRYNMHLLLQVLSCRLYLSRWN